MKILVIYYSLEGTTKKCVEYLAKNDSVDLEQLVLQRPNNYHSFMKYIWGGFQVIFKKKPKINSLKHNLDNYEVIIFATPIWASTITPAIRTVLNQYDFTNKKISWLTTDLSGKHQANRDFFSLLNDVEFLPSLSLTKCKDDYQETFKKIDQWFNHDIG